MLAQSNNLNDIGLTVILSINRDPEKWNNQTKL